MLPPERRMRRSDEFRRAVRRGRRAGSRLLVVHLLDPDAADVSASVDVAPADLSAPGSTASTEPAPCRVGFVVGRGVGGSVVRSQVTRRLRHLVRDRLDRLPSGSLLVVRAQGPSGPASSAALAIDLDRALDRVLARPRTSGPA